MYIRITLYVLHYSHNNINVRFNNVIFQNCPTEHKQHVDRRAHQCVHCTLISMSYKLNRNNIATRMFTIFFLYSYFVLFIIIIINVFIICIITNIINSFKMYPDKNKYVYQKIDSNKCEIIG